MCSSVYEFSSFHPNNFLNTISWECFIKNDGIRSCLIELQSFLLNKIDVDPIHSVLRFHPCFMDVPVAVHSSRSYQDPCVLYPLDLQAERILSVCCSKF